MFRDGSITGLRFNFRYPQLSSLEPALNLYLCFMKVKSGLVALALLCSVRMFGVEYQYPFQDPSLSDDERIDNLISLMTLEEKVRMYGGAGVTRLGVRGPGSSEAIHGVVQGGPAWNPNRFGQVTTSFPQAYGLGETWDRNLIHDVASHIGYEGRYLFQSPKHNKAGLILWAPNADLGRDVRWGRTEECFGEDPFLVSQLVVSFVKGLQGDDDKYWQSASLMKHFFANSNESGRTETSSDFNEKLLREYYTYPFMKGITEGGANALMTSYNAYNGTPCTISPVLRNILQKEWGFDGMIITDGGAFSQLKTTHKVFDNLEDAAQACIKAGTSRFLDNYRDALMGAYNRGLVTESDIEQNIRGNIRLMIKLGLLDLAPENPYSSIGLTDTIDPWTKPETKEFVRHVANKSAVLLKNDKGMLPIKIKPGMKIAVIGNKADKVLEDWYCGNLPYKVTPLEGIRNYAEAHGAEVKYVKDNKRGLAEDAARWADYVLVCVGNDPTCSVEWAKAPWGEGAFPSEGREDVDRISLQLDQEDLLKRLYKANPNTALVLISSFPYAINWSQENLPSILHFTQSCQELGNSVADVVFGEFNPAGRTTQTWPKDINQLPHILDYDITDGRTYMYFDGEPLYPFGHGLSYTDFKYVTAETDKKSITKDDLLTVNVEIANTGNYDGEEVVQIYAQLPGDDAKMRLRAFDRVPVKKNETVTVPLTIKASDLALWDDAKKEFVLPKGKMKLLIGSSSSDIKLTKTVDLK